MKYKRIILKLSGEALKGEKYYGIDQNKLKYFCSEIKEIYDCGVQIAIVIGGGNFFRGEDAHYLAIQKSQGDYMGMLATVINAMALQSILENEGMDTRLISKLKMEQICEPYIRRRAIRHLEKGRIIIFGSGLGIPNFTTDSAASSISIEIEADVVLKGTRVDGVYSEDPEINKNATRYTHITYAEALQQKLNVMDSTAFTLCQEHKKPIIVFDMNKKGNLLNLIKGINVGTLID